MNDFLLLRPWWLLALLALPLLHWWQLRHQSRNDSWQRAVDPHLLKHLLESQPGRTSKVLSWLLQAVLILAIIAMAGPSLRQTSAPLVQVQAPLVIALDLSSAMRAADLQPSRLAQAKAKLTALLTARKGGQLGLLVFAGEAFSAAPITRDANTLKALVESLSPDLMPADGQRVDRAIDEALRLLRGANFSGGEILVVSDHADAAAQNAATRARTAGFRVSVLGVGTAAGAPLSNQQGFIAGADGQVQLARLDVDSLRALASAGGGSYATLSRDERDLRALGVLNADGRVDDNSVDAASAATGAQRSDDGYWLLLLMLPLMLLCFRRGWLTVLLPGALLLGSAGVSPPALAADPAATPTAEPAAPANESQALQSNWSALWQTAEQRARLALEQGQYATAKSLTSDPAVQGAADFRSEDFAAAAETWATRDDADSHYNRGTALAKAGEYEDALKAFDAALKQQPDMADALANRQAVADFLKQQQQQQQQQQSGSQDQQKQDQQDQQDQQKQDQSGQSQQQDSQQQSGESQDSQESQQQDQSGQPKDTEQEQSGEPKESDSSAQEDGQEGKSGEPESEQKEAEQQAGKDGKDGKDGEKGEQQPPTGTPKEASEAQREAEQKATEAARQAMQQALDGKQEGEPGQEPAVQVAEPSPEQRAEAEQQQALQQWLRRVPDDPGGLLRRKFALEHQRRLRQQKDQ